MKMGIPFKLPWTSAHGQQTDQQWEVMLQKKNNQEAKYVGETQVLRKAFFKKETDGKEKFPILSNF